MDARHERVSRNEAMYRTVNLELKQANASGDDQPDEKLELICECGEDGCSATLELTTTEYDDAHRQRDRFVVAPGHEDEQIEHVVKRTDRFLVVDKFGAAERVAEAEETREGAD
jgi:hypothetical protein